MAQPKTMEQFQELAATTYGERKDEFLSIFPAGSEEEAKQSQARLALLQFAAYGDYFWARRNSAESYLYFFSHVPADKPGFPNYGAFHTSEVPYALHTLKLWDRPWTDADYQVEKDMSGYWINFVKNLNPNGKGLPEWKNYNIKNPVIMELGNQPVPRPGFFNKEFQFFESLDK
jgi:para-nitrobenzyl esterase